MIIFILELEPNPAALRQTEISVQSAHSGFRSISVDSDFAAKKNSVWRIRKFLTSGDPPPLEQYALLELWKCR